MADSICPSTAAPGDQPDGAAVARVEKALHRRGAFTEIMGKVLDFCRKYVDQSQAAIAFMLVEAGGLARIDLDRDGNPVDPARLASLDEDAADELVQFCALETTPAGVQVAQAHRPEVRLEELFARTPERNDAYRAILRAASEPKTFAEIEALLGKQLSLPSLNGKSGLPLYPSALVAHLEKAGGLVWDEAWSTTPAGASFATSNERSK